MINVHCGHYGSAVINGVPWWLSQLRIIIHLNVVPAHGLCPIASPLQLSDEEVYKIHPHPQSLMHVFHCCILVKTSWAVLTDMFFFSTTSGHVLYVTLNSGCKLYLPHKSSGGRTSNRTLCFITWTWVCSENSALCKSCLIDNPLLSDTYLMPVRLEGCRGHGFSGFLRELYTDRSRKWVV